MTIGSLRVLKLSHGGQQPVQGSTKPAVGVGADIRSVVAPGSGGQPQRRPRSASPAAAGTPKCGTWWSRELSNPLDAAREAQILLHRVIPPCLVFRDGKLFF